MDSRIVDRLHEVSHPLFTWNCNSYEPFPSLDIEAILLRGLGSESSIIVVDGAHFIIYEHM